MLKNLKNTFVTLINPEKAKGAKISHIIVILFNDAFVVDNSSFSDKIIAQSFSIEISDAACDNPVTPPHKTVIIKSPDDDQVENGESV